MRAGRLRDWVGRARAAAIAAVATSAVMAGAMAVDTTPVRRASADAAGGLRRDRRIRARQRDQPRLRGALDERSRRPRAPRARASRAHLGDRAHVELGVPDRRWRDMRHHAGLVLQPRHHAQALRRRWHRHGSNDRLHDRRRARRTSTSRSGRRPTSCTARAVRGGMEQRASTGSPHRSRSRSPPAPCCRAS